MSGYVLRRSLLSLMTLGAILVIGGGVLVAMGVPVWVPLVVSLLLIGLQYAINPALLQWLVPASLIPLTPDGDGYATDHPVGAIVARRCREAGIPLVRLGIVARQVDQCLHAECRQIRIVVLFWLRASIVIGVHAPEIVDPNRGDSLTGPQW